MTQKNINRWYDAKVGRWCSEDPIGFRGRGNNLNSYISNNSVCKTDSFGLVEDDVVAHAILNQNDLTYIINGREESATLNTQAGAGFPPFNWRIGLDVTHLGVLYDIEEMTCCFKPKFTVYGVVAILIRPSDNQVASNPHTNDDIWAAWFVAESSTISPVPTSLDDYQSCVVNHEVQHYATFLEFLSISKTGLGALETCSSAEDEAEVKGQHGIAEFERLYNLASAHSKKYDGAWKSDSYKAERIHPFSEEFKIIY